MGDEQAGEALAVTVRVSLVAAVAFLVSMAAAPMSFTLRPIVKEWSRDEVRAYPVGIGGDLITRWESYEVKPDGTWTLVGTYRSTSPDGEGFLPVVRDVPMLALARIYDPNLRNENGDPREVGHCGYYYTYDGLVTHLDAQH